MYCKHSSQIKQKFIKNIKKTFFQNIIVVIVVICTVQQNTYISSKFKRGPLIYFLPEEPIIYWRMLQLNLVTLLPRSLLYRLQMATHLWQYVIGTYTTSVSFTCQEKGGLCKQWGGCRTYAHKYVGVICMHLAAWLSYISVTCQSLQLPVYTTTVLYLPLLHYRSFCVPCRSLSSDVMFIGSQPRE